MLHSSIVDIQFALSDIPSQGLPTNVLMVTPDHFQVEYTINPHMVGHIGAVDSAEALVQWDHLRRAYHALGLNVKEM